MTKRFSLDHPSGCSIASLRSLRWMFMKKKETLNFRVSVEFKRRLIQEAEKERRSLTNYLETTLTNLWDQAKLTVTRKREPRGTKL